jgi:predicted nuclease of restriction endonuclease-like (RecB) superfamily
MENGLIRKPEGYEKLLNDLKARIQATRTRARLSVNRELVLLYCQIGREILHRQEEAGWGAKVLEQLSHDLRCAFPEMKGFSVRNLKYMRTLAREWPEGSIGQQLAAQLPWFHTCTLLEKVKDLDARLWYAHSAIEHGWSRNVLTIHIDRVLYAAKGAALTNFQTTLPAPQSDLAHEVLNDPYKLDFLGVGDDVAERELERGLVEHIREFLLELGQGFTFYGSQVPLEVDGEEFHIDLLFYHLKLRCFVVIELKVGKFKPEYAGKLNFYLSAVDDLLRHPDDSPSIGIVLCKDRNQVVVEYALRGLTQPIGVSKFELTKALPESLKGRLPTVEDLEAEMEDSKE